MGVPGFYTWLIKRYPLCFNRVQKNETPNTDNFYLDLNAILYRCAKDDQTIFKDLLLQKNFEEIWVLVFNYINKLVNYASPQKLIYLALDGTAPRAKQNQQRSRRFQSALSHRELNENLLIFGKEYKDKQGAYKNNSISPGTDFMHDLNKQLHFYVQKKIKEDERWKKLKIIVSGSDVPGEGEHKILEYIREYGQNSDTHCIYGCDADLIMLGLSTSLKYVSILREEYTFQSKVATAAKRHEEEVQFQVIYLNIVREYFHFEFKDVEMKHLDYNINNIIDDFLCICMFIGNDFLPRLSSFNIREGNFELLLNAFKIQLKYGKEYLNDRGSINLKSLYQLTIKIIIVLCEQSEDEDIDWFSLKKPIRDKELSKDTRVSYYKDKMKIDIEQEEGKKELNNICQKYIEGLHFVMEYYYRNNPSWKWFYPYYYAPQAIDIYEFLHSNQYQQIQFKQDEPFKPFQQLLAILNPGNSGLLPEALGKLLTNKESPLRSPIDYYTDQFEVDSYGNVFAHEFIVILPFLQMDQFLEAYYKVEPTLNDFEKQKNQLSVAKIYQFDKSIEPYSVKSSLPNVFQEFKSYAKIIDLPQIKYKKTSFKNNETYKNMDITQQFKSKDLFQLPSLFAKNILTYQFMEVQSYNKRGKRLTLGIEREINLELVKKPLKIFFNYPQSYRGLLIGYIDELRLTKLKLNAFIPLLSEIHYSANKHVEKYMFIVQQTERNMEEIGLDFSSLKEPTQEQLDDPNYKKPMNRIAFVRVFNEFTRTSNGQIEENETNYEDFLVPEPLLMKKQKVQSKEYQRQIFTNLSNEFPLNNTVMVFDKQYDASIGVTQKVNQKKGLISVQLNQHVPNFFKVDKYISDQNIYHSVSHVSNQIGCEVEVLMQVLDKVIVKIDQEQRSAEKLSDSVDIGFNVINRKTNMIVPELLRIHKANNNLYGREKYAMWSKGLDISVQMVEQIVEFKTKFPEVFRAVKNNINRKEKLTSADIFPVEDDPNINLMQIYFWMLMLPSSKLHQCGLQVQVINRTKIKQLEYDLKNYYKKNPSQAAQDEVIEINPQKIYQSNSQVYLPLYWRECPPYHQLGDRVVNLNQSTDNSIPFGLVGTVVGIHDYKFEILFDKPFIGGINLQGRCSNMRGAVVDFQDVYNLNSWNGYLTNRSQNVKNWGWQGDIEQFIPEFSGKSIKNAENQEQLESKLGVKNPYKELHQVQEEEKKKLVYKPGQVFNLEDIQNPKYEVETLNVNDIEQEQQVAQQNIQLTKQQSVEKNHPQQMPNLNQQQQIQFQQFQAQQQQYMKFLQQQQFLASKQQQNQQQQKAQQQQNPQQGQKYVKKTAQTPKILNNPNVVNVQELNQDQQKQEQPQQAQQAQQPQFPQQPQQTQQSLQVQQEKEQENKENTQEQQKQQQQQQQQNVQKPLKVYEQKLVLTGPQLVEFSQITVENFEFKRS